MKKAEPIYLTGYVSMKDLKAFREGYSSRLDLWTSLRKTQKEEVELKVPLEFVYQTGDCYYIRREDFAHQF